ncbi:hypothetical protein PF008_g29044 [Phytophthora fragariae]|uniref:Uncharacterized protein n=1 Tax=Phytophthora fragariae TaxID=53985 RepID=A0A6G0Q9L8_9STRA|nr:hypothetical protein PF008_g29044 [Phytophthora fragariae]
MKYDAMARSSPDALAESWDVFVEGLVVDEDAWMAGLKKVKAAFMKYNLDGDKIQVHVQSIAEGVPCCVTTDQRCPMCYLDSPKATGVVRRGEVGNISTELYHLIKHLDLRWRFRSRAVAEDKARKRMMQSDVLDDMPLAQVDPSKSEQRLRDIQTDVYLAGLSSHQVRETVKSLVEYRVSAEGQIKNLERQLEEIQTLLYNSGIYQRQRK